jgi:hypothetical protein
MKKWGMFFAISYLVGFSCVLFSQTTPFSTDLPKIATTLKGIAPSYVGQKIDFFEVVDYFTYDDSLIGSVIVGKDSTFSISIDFVKEQKVIVRPPKCKGFLFVTPGQLYNLIIQESESKNPNFPDKEIEIDFINLSKKDINYKIIVADEFMNAFLGDNFNKKTLNSPLFKSRLDSLKKDLGIVFKNDSSLFLNLYLKYNFASIDQIPYKGAPSQLEKYNLYLNNVPVAYQSEMYMRYIRNYYKNLLDLFPSEMSDRIYKSIIGIDPYDLFTVFGKDATLKNHRLRELVMLKSLADEYYKGRYPKSNILSMIDTVYVNSRFSENKRIARNIVLRLTELKAGNPAPFFQLCSNEVDTSKAYVTGKYTYIQFLSSTSETYLKELQALKASYNAYNKFVEFITVLVNDNQLEKKPREFVDKLPWKKHIVASSDSILKLYLIENFPSYVLIDDEGLISAFPALGPTPNGNLETIEHDLYSVKKIMEERIKEERRNSMDNVFGK